MPREEKARKENFPFTADQIGSEILERFSQDIYTPKAIVRELVKNAYDSYPQLEKHLEEIGQDLDIEAVVRVDVVEKSIMISDEGLGQDKDDLERLVSIALTEKREIAGVTGFRGIGFWSAYTGGDTIVVETTKFGVNRLYRLTLNTKRMRQLQGPGTSLGRIMNDPECMHLVSESAPEEAHSTKVLILAESEDARLRPLLSSPDLMRKVLLEGCSCRLTDGSPHSERVSAFYEANGIRPAQLLFQNTEEITKALPPGLSDIAFQTLEMKVGSRKVSLAKVWYATNTRNARIDSPIAGIRLCRENFPVGLPNSYSDRDYPDSGVVITRPDLLSWHIGEVHLLDEELRPNASGEGVRDSILFTQFRELLREFYKSLIETAYAKQRQVSMRTDYRKMKERVINIASKRSEGARLTEDECRQLRTIAETVQRDNRLAKGKLAEGAAAGSREALVRDEEVKKTRRGIFQALKDLGVEDTTGGGAPKRADKKRQSEASNQPAAKTTPTDAIPRATVLAMLDELRDAVIEVLKDERSYKHELLARINEIGGRV